jgi:class 3 adenylate cyclase
VEFASVVDAVRCAVAVQLAMPERDSGIRADSRIELRIGVNLGDAIVEADDLYGDRCQHRRTDRGLGRCRRGVRLQYGS